MCVCFFCIAFFAVSTCIPPPPAPCAVLPARALLSVCGGGVQGGILGSRVKEGAGSYPMASTVAPDPTEWTDLRGWPLLQATAQGRGSHPPSPQSQGLLPAPSAFRKYGPGKRPRPLLWPHAIINDRFLEIHRSRTRVSTREMGVFAPDRTLRWSF